ncbi:fructosamine kinase [Cryptococcus neoformans Bt1]|nr:fructosamine kinase [Cryptococcus neoformans var. grubii Bt1]
MPTITQPIANIFKAAHIPANELSIAASTSGFIITHSTTGKQYFTKTDRNVPQMRGEVASLLAMSKTSRGLVPEVLGFEVSPDGKEATMVTQWFDLSSARGGHTQRGLGSKLAQMHMPPPEGTEGYEGKYGFPVPTHCGATEQDNTWEESWEVFWRDRRLGNLVNRIGDKEINALWEDMKRKAVPLLLHSFSPAPQPVILHGDLWSGNAGYDETTSSPVIFDPASYYGHNEADLGITRMFGGFSYEFYDEYHQVHPRSSPYYDERQKLYELYHHLNVRFYFLHTVHAANPSNHLHFNLSDHSFSNE